MRKITLVGALAALLAGCSQEADLSADREEKLRNNLERPLSAEELKQMGQSKTEGAGKLHDK